MDEDVRDAEGLYNFAFEQFEHYRSHNPEIARAIDEFCCGAGRNESAQVMFPIFYALRNIKEDIAVIPRISANSAQKAKEELTEAGGDILELPVFKEFLGAIRHFVFFLDISVKTEELKRKAKLLFAVILRMIQIEKAGRAG